MIPEFELFEDEYNGIPATSNVDLIEWAWSTEGLTMPDEDNQ